MYGLDWAIVTDPVARELHMCAKGGSWQVKGKTVGNGPAYHYKTGMMLLWPEIKWWKGCDLILDNYITHRSMAILGPASLGKTFLCSALAQWDYFIDPQKTKVLICSTTAERMRDRIWGQVVRFHTLAKKHHSWLPGHVISGRMRLLTNERLDSDNPEDCGSGCMGLPCKRGENLITLSDFAGLKAPRLRLFGDEVQFLPIGFVHAISGLDKNPDLKVVGMGNPKDTIDALGILAEPSQELGGWDGGIDQQGSSKSWSTRRPDGCAVQLVCYDSPNLDGKFGAPLITQEQIDRDIAVYGKNSIQFTMLNEGRMPHGMSSKRILTRQECHLQKAHEAPLWLNSALTDIVYLDAAYGGVGGDRCILGHLKFGRESLAAAISEPNKDGIVAQLQPVDRNRQIIALETSMVLPIEITAKKTIVDQIVDFCKNYCVQRGIPPQNFFYDSGMRTALVQRFGEHWPGTNSIDCGGEPSDRNVSGDIQIPAKTYYRKKITELWYSVRWTVISGQMRSLPEDEMQELTSREWRMTAGNKIEVEPKPLMKSKFGRSPDKADGLAIGIEGARQKGFVIRRFVLPSKQNVKSTQWKQDLRQQARDLWNSGTIQEDAA